ncbi:MAG: hypothetical protein QXJ17_05820 [Nitrososphaeria archaeon]
MSTKSRAFSPSILLFLFTGIVFTISPIFDITSYEMLYVGIVNLLALAATYVKRFSPYKPFIKISVMVFNIIVFSYQIYSTLVFANIGFSLNVITTIFVSILFLASNLIALLFYSHN